jgi:hypothetical protein
MDSLLVGILHSIDCDGAVNASSMLTCETTPPAGRPIHLGGRLRQNGGRHQIGMLDGIRSERWAPSAQNARTVSVRTCTDIGTIMRESLAAEAEALALYKELLTVVEGSTVMLEEYARQMVQAEELHAGDVDKMLRQPGEVAAFRPNASKPQ